jgi:hypothetical protein
MAVASPCGLVSRLASRVMARPVMSVPKCLGNPSRVRLMSAASAIPERHEDSAVSVQHNQNAVSKKGGNQAMQRRPRRHRGGRGVNDVSPFGMQIFPV